MVTAAFSPVRRALLLICERNIGDPAKAQIDATRFTADAMASRGRVIVRSSGRIAPGAAVFGIPTLDQRDKSTLRVAVAFDISLRRLNGAVSRKKLYIPQGAASLVNAACRARDERSAPRVRRTSR